MTEYPGALPQEVVDRELGGLDVSRSTRGLAPIPDFAETPAVENNFQEFSRRKILGLAFSGGGIRSATFNLGVLRALDELGLLRYVDYLSTVSGGGYIGSWFLAGRLRKLTVDNAKAVDHLRRYSRYLSPQAGFLSADSWAMAMIWLRNAMLLQATLAAFLAAILCLPRIGAQIFDWMPAWLAAILSVVPVIFAVSRACTYLHKLGPPRPERVWHDDSLRASLQRMVQKRAIPLERWWRKRMGDQGRIQLEIVVPLLVSGFASSVLLWKLRAATDVLPLTGVLVAFLIWFLVKNSIDQRRLSEYWADWAVLVALACAGVFIGLMHVLAGLFSDWAAHTCNNQAHWHAVIWGAPLFLLDCAVIIVLQIGLVGRGMPDGLREWWSRLGAFLGIYSAGVLAIGCFAIYGPLALATLWGWAVAAVSAGGVIGTITGFLAARSSQTGSPEKTTNPFLEAAASLAPYLFIVGLGGLLSLGLHSSSVWFDFAPGATTAIVNEACTVPGSAAAGALTLAAHQTSASAAQMTQFHWAILNHVNNVRPWWPSLALLLLALVTAILAWRVDINQFSMNLFYRHRLVRCYLGASRTATGERQPDEFLGFDFKDEVSLSEFRPERGFDGPIAIINTALNLQGHGDPSLEERRATSFTLTPYFCGSQQTGYAPTETYSRPEGGIRLGTAIATSGAAASPNSGYHTSSPVAFLMTFFNVRLGLWAANPRYADGRLADSPRWGFWYLLKELFASADDHDRFIYLSDGGHFENLGIYELVRRRCRFIIAGDAEQDGTLSFESLGGVIRKCRIDLNVEIELNTNLIRQTNESGFNLAHCAIGRIRYPEGIEGTLIYLKSSVTGDEDGDVLQYKRQNAAFPHESTGDQFFSESQFESYRKLGYHIAMDGLASVARFYKKPLLEGIRPGMLDDIATDLRQKWAPMPPGAGKAFTHHAATLNGIWEQMRADRDLSFLDEQIFPGLPAVQTGPGGRAAEESPQQMSPIPQDQRRFRKAFYLCQSVIQLMENVYLDLGLETQSGSIDNRGWMNLFRRWAWSSMFRVTYSLTSSTYGARFQTFCERQLGLTPGHIRVSRSRIEELNFLEKQAAQWLTQQLKSTSEPTIWRLRLVVDTSAPSEDALVQLPVGFAMVQDATLVGMRVQNHLRRMGVARRARTEMKLQRAYRREAVISPPADEEPF